MYIKHQMREYLLHAEITKIIFICIMMIMNHQQKKQRQYELSYYHYCSVAHLVNLQLNSYRIPPITMTKIAMLLLIPFIFLPCISNLLTSSIPHNLQTAATAIASIDNQTLWVPYNATNIQVNLVGKGYYNIGQDADVVQIYLIFQHEGMQPCSAINQGTFRNVGYLQVRKNCTIPGPIFQSQWITFKASATSNRGAYGSHTKTVRLHVGDDKINDGGSSVVVIVAVSIGAAVVVLGVGGYFWFKRNQKKKGKKLLESLQTI